MPMCGGISEIKEANLEVQGVVDQVVSLVNQKTGQNYNKLTAVKYGTQVVAGTNYFVKVSTDDSKYLHLRIFKPLPHTNQGPELHSVQPDKKIDDPIEYF